MKPGYAQVRSWLWSLVLWLALMSSAAADRVISTYRAADFSPVTKPGKTLLLKIEKPSIETARYALRGKLSFEGVQGGYLELFNHFPGGQVFFTRSLAESGPLGKLNGSSSAHSFNLPFDATAPGGTVLHPQRLELYVVLPSGGKVQVQSAELVEVGGGETGWYSNRQAGLVGGVAGSLLGCLGGLLGALASQGKGRSFVLGTARLMIVLGALVLIAGTVAVAESQPYHVFYPLLLMGVLMTVIFGSVLPSLTRRYTEMELRRMQALDRIG